MKISKVNESIMRLQHLEMVAGNDNAHRFTRPSIRFKIRPSIRFTTRFTTFNTFEKSGITITIVITAIMKGNIHGKDIENISFD